MDEPNPLTRVIKPVVAVQEAVKPVAEPAKKKLQVPKLFDVETSLGIGDVMTVLTLLPGLRQKYPDWTIRVITEKPDWANLGHDYAIRRSEFEASNTVGELNFKQTELGGDWRNYDLEAIERKSTRHEVFGKRIGVAPQRFTLRVFDDIKYWANKTLSGLGRAKVVGISPYSTSPQRNWPDENWVCLVERLFYGGYMPVVLGGPDDNKRSQYYPCMRYWGMSAQQTAALVSQCALVISNDSGMAHVSALLNVPAIVMGAPNSTSVVFEWYGNVLCLQAKSKCGLCYWKKERGFRQECNYRCRLLAMIEPEAVFQEAKKLLDRP